METMSVSNNTGKSRRHSEAGQRLSWLEAIFYPLIKVNFALSVKLNQWREDRFSSLASRITSWQVFFLSGGGSLWLLPPIKTWNDIYWASGTLLFLFFCALFGMHKWVMYIVYKSRMGSRISKKRKIGRLQILSFAMSWTAFLFFAITIILKAYWYHTRFFWWNK